MYAIWNILQMITNKNPLSKHKYAHIETPRITTIMLDSFKNDI